jgi:hypothetical protein
MAPFGGQQYIYHRRESSLTDILEIGFEDEHDCSQKPAQRRRARDSESRGRSAGPPHEWGYYETLLIYWCEALIIGAYNLLRLLVVGLASEQPDSHARASVDRPTASPARRRRPGRRRSLTCEAHLPREAPPPLNLPPDSARRSSSGAGVQKAGSPCGLRANSRTRRKT